MWSQFRRWSRNSTRARALTVLHHAAREAEGRAETTRSMVIIDTHLARGASNGGSSFHDRGGAYGRTKGTKGVLAVDVTGLPLGPLVVPASTHENRTTELKLGHLARQGVTGRLELVLVDRGVTATAAQNLSRAHGLEVRQAGWTTSSRCSSPSGTPGGSRSPTAGSAGLFAWPSPSRTPPRRPPAARRLHRGHPAAPARPHRRAWLGPHPGMSRAARPLSGRWGRRRRARP